MKHRLRGLDPRTWQPRTWAAITVLAVLFSFGWTWYATDQTEDSLRADLVDQRRTNQPLIERVTVLEKFVELSNQRLEACERKPEDCQGPVAPPVEDITPQAVPRAVGPTYSQVEAAALSLLPGMVADYLQANPPAKGDEGEPGQAGPPGESIKGDPGEAGPQGRGIASVTCTGMTAPATFVITYTDGTTQEVECQMLPPVEDEDEGG